MSGRELTLTLPYPPSVNHYWKHTKTGRHYISEEGKAYQSKVFVACLSELPFDKPVTISAKVWFPDNRKRDLDNLWKVILDSIANAKIVEDDCWQCVPELNIKAMGIQKGGRLEVTIKEQLNVD